MSGRFLRPCLKQSSGCRPWLSGAFGLELTEAMHAMQKVMDPSHPLLSKEVDNIWFDLDMDPDDEADPMKLLREATCFGHEVTWALDCKKKQLPIAGAKTVLLGGVVRPQQRASLVSRLRRSLPPMSLRFCFEGPGTSKSTSLQRVVFAVQSTVKMTARLGHGGSGSAFSMLGARQRATFRR